MSKREMLSERKLEGYLKLAEIIQWGRKYPVRFVETFFGIELLDYQKYVFMNSWTKPFVLWVMSRNAGKALALDTPIPTPNGFTTMGKLKVGDYVLDENNKPTKITFVSDVFIGNDCYELTFDDGEKIVADADHIWLVKQEINEEHELLTSKDIFRSFCFLEKNNIENEILVPLAKSKRTETESHKKIVSIKKVPSVATKCISVDSDSKLYLAGKNHTVTHNTTLAAPFIMAKSMLFPNFQTYILAGTGSQAQGTFMKIEDIALKRISSFTGLTDVFANETVKSATNKTGFTHKPSSFEVTLYNGSKINSLNSIPDNIRGHRSNLNFYDESGFTEEELFKASEPFLTQNTDFRLGGGDDPALLPKQFPNQRIYASSASSTDTYFYKQYKEFSQRMFLGDSRYFVADINADLVINATYNGKVFPVSLLSQDVVDAAMRDNKEKAMREYMNIFTTEGSDQQIIKRAMIVRNSELRKPILSNDGDRKFIFAIDPARSHDNSIMTIAELVDDPEVGYKLKIVNMVSFTDIEKKKKTPMKTPDQVKMFKQALLDYNGKRVADYENIVKILLDDGSGGGGISAWADSLLEDWEDTNGRKHKGLIDPEHDEYKDIVNRYPNASDKLKLITPQKYKNAMFAALQEMMKHDLISFTETYDGKGELVFTEIEGDDAGKTKIYTLSDDEIMALVNIDLAKEELVSIYEFKNGSNVRYDLAPDKKNKMHDDRAYTIAMLAWYLQELRRERTIKKEPEFNIDDYKYFMSAGF